MRILLLGAFLLACCVGTFSRLAQADGLIRDGLGARVAGRGGTNIAWADSGTILHDNPSGAVNICGDSLLEVGADVLFADLDYRDPGTNASYDSDPVPLGNATYIKKLSPDVAVGLGVYSSGGFATDWQMTGAPGFPGDRKYKSFGALGRVLPAVSLRMTDRWTVGATLGVAASHIELEGPYTLQSAPLQGTPTLIDLQATGAALTWSVGLQYQLSSRTTLGLTYQSETRFGLHGSATSIVPGLGQTAYDLDMDMVWPRSLGIGWRHQWCQHRTLGVDVIYYNWQQAFDSVGMVYREATNPAFWPLGQINEQTPLRWRDTVSIRTGYQFTTANQKTWRCGYVYHRNPIPTATLTPYIAPALEHTVSLGYGTQWGEWEVDYGYQYMFGSRQQVAASSLAGGDFDQSSLKAQAHFLYISFLRR